MLLTHRSHTRSRLIARYRVTFILPDLSGDCRFTWIVDARDGIQETTESQRDVADLIAFALDPSEDDSIPLPLVSIKAIRLLDRVVRDWPPRCSYKVVDGG